VSTLVAVEQLYDALDERTLEILELRRRRPIARRRGWLVRRALLVADIAGLSLAFVLAQEIYAAQAHNPGSFSQATEFVGFVLSLPFWVIATKLYGLYDRDEERTDHSSVDDFSRVFHLITVCTFLLYAVSLLTRWFNPEFSKLLLFWVLAIFGTVSLRVAARAYCRRQIHYLQNAIIVGAGEVGQSIALKLLNHHEYGINLVGFVDANPKERNEGLRHLSVLGDTQDLPVLVRLLDVERVIFAFSGDTHEESLEAVHQLSTCDVQIDVVPRFFDGLGPSVRLHTVEGVPLVSMPPRRLSWSSLVIKRSLDVFLSLVGLVVLAPAFVVVAGLIKWDSKGPVFYRHERVGRGRQSFGLFKFRTMYLEACRGDAYGGAAAEQAFAQLISDPQRRAEFHLNYKFQDDPRATRVGRVLRKTSIDELPQLLNVLIGNLSLVGPRALTDEELEQYYGASADALLAIRPGITGYWQINGRSRLEYEDRVRLDLAYIGGWSLGLDLTILAKTARTIFARSGAY
jgi:exopolysaccharide biosynthesis polyprenyl glycosylphosphotransferase